MREALTAVLLAAALLVFAQPAPYVAAPDQADIIIRGRAFNSLKWVRTPYSEVLLYPPHGDGAWHFYFNVDNQLVLTHWGRKYLVADQTGYPGNMQLIQAMTWEEREKWRAEQ